MLGTSFAFVTTRLVNLTPGASPQMKLACAPTIVVTFCAFRRTCVQYLAGGTENPKRFQTRTERSNKGRLATRPAGGPHTAGRGFRWQVEPAGQSRRAQPGATDDPERLGSDLNQVTAFMGTIKMGCRFVPIAPPIPDRAREIRAGRCAGSRSHDRRRSPPARLRPPGRISSPQRSRHCQGHRHHRSQRKPGAPSSAFVRRLVFPGPERSL